MKNIRIKEIRISDFKGQTRNVAFNDEKTTITGPNGSGKTTILRAFTWLLTGKTEPSAPQNSELFDNTKPIVKETPPAIVEATVIIDGKEHTFCRTATAKFSRPKGSTEWVKASSDDYEYRIDGLPFTAGDFSSWISNMIAPYELLPYCIGGDFFAHLAANDRERARKTLCALIGNVSPKDEEKYQDIVEDLAELAPEMLIVKYRETIRKNANDMNALPAKAEVAREYLSQIGEIGEDLDEVKINEDLKALYSRLYGEEGYYKLMEKKGEIDKQILNKKEALAEARLKINTMSEAISNDGEKCPTCGRKMKLSQKRKMNMEKEIEILSDDIGKNNASIEALEKKSEALRERMVKAYKTLEKDTEKYDKLLEERSRIESVNAKNKSDRARKSQLEKEISGYEESMRECGNTIAETERKKMLLEIYIQDSAEALGNAVNSHFKNTRIQMFDTQKNGEKKPSCLITDAKGVKYSTLNYSARLLANLEISRLFCRLCGVNMPCFVDECSVFDSSHLPAVTGAQMVYMRCSDDQELVVL